MAGKLVNINRCCRSRILEIAEMLKELRERWVSMMKANPENHEKIILLLGQIIAVDDIVDFLRNEMETEKQ